MCSNPYKLGQVINTLLVLNNVYQLSIFKISFWYKTLKAFNLKLFTIISIKFVLCTLKLKTKYFNFLGGSNIFIEFANVCYSLYLK